MAPIKRDDVDLFPSDDPIVFSCITNTVLIFDGLGQLLYCIKIGPRDVQLEIALGNESMTAAYFSVMQSWCYKQRFGEPARCIHTDSYEVHFLTRDLPILPEQPVRNDDLENRVYMALIGRYCRTTWDVPTKMIRPILEGLWDTYLIYHYSIKGMLPQVLDIPELDAAIRLPLLHLNRLIQVCQRRVILGDVAIPY